MNGVFTTLKITTEIQNDSPNILTRIPKMKEMGWRGKNRQMASALRVAEIQAKGHKAFGSVAWHGGQLCWLGALLARPLLRISYGSPLRGCSRQAALTAAHGLPGRCFASATVSRNGLCAIESALP